MNDNTNIYVIQHKCCKTCVNFGSIKRKLNNWKVKYMINVIRILCLKAFCNLTIFYYKFHAIFYSQLLNNFYTFAQICLSYENMDTSIAVLVLYDLPIALVTWFGYSPIAIK